VVIWLFAAISRGRAARERWSGQQSMLQSQADWLDKASLYQEQLQSRLAQVQQGRSLNANQLVGQLDAVLKRQHLASFRLDPATTERKPPVAIHSVALTLEKVDLPALAAFTDELRTALPLVNIDQLAITPDRRNPAQLDVRLRLNGLELLP
jgi:hypothetical protein